MERYIAFLRGINVSGQKLIKMEALRRVLADNGFADVKTFIQSGNVIFSAAITDSKHLILVIEDLIEKHFGFRTDVILRRHSEIENVLGVLEVIKFQEVEDRKYYITFAKEEFSVQVEVPVFSKNHDVEIIYHNKKDFISVSKEYKGTYGFPNSFIEKLTGIPSTTRNPNTLGKILKL
ncbi:MAG: DUF1697 domain-containing protein [Bacteroidales bacterium]|nr:DUF1697 domain-containing protein [Bacteroidales bacterium]